jgi:hypothetical protein
MGHRVVGQIFENFEAKFSWYIIYTKHFHILP